MQQLRSSFWILCGLCIVFFASPVWAGYVNNGNGTVTDTSTGLMWQQDTPDNTMTWEQALSYCENSNLAGYTDWRLPTKKELRRLVDYSRYNPAINITYFPDTVSSFYWSSTTNANYTDNAWGVYFNDGYANNSNKNYSYYVRAVRGGQSGSLGDLVIAQQPMSGPPGTTFVEWGTGFTPNSTATLHFKKLDGTEYDTKPQPMDAIGHFEINYTAPWDKPPGIYTWWAVDGVTGAKSNVVSYTITPLSTNLEIQTINPQSSSSFYGNFFPSPIADQLISGGTASSMIAADGESRLLLRIVANNPGQVTISESLGNTQQNGSLSGLSNYRDASPASTVSVQLKQYGSQYIGFAVYRVPIDFSVSGYENRLTRPITLNISYIGGNSTVSLTLRRPPIFISHGLWSWGWGNEAIESFRNTIWNRFTDSGGKNVNDYIWLNDCLSQNADGVLIGSNKTRSNIRDYLKYLRSCGATVTQVDYLGHSMGGQWGRLVQQRFSKDSFTYDRGYLHKLITLDTPHVGSFVADILQYVLDNAADIPMFGGTNARDYLILFSDEFQKPVGNGAIKDLTSYGSIENLKEVSVPSHAIMGNKHIDTACALLSASSWVSGGTAEPIVKILQVAEMILKIINPAYGCENWFNKFDFSTETDYIVDLHSQKGGLIGSNLNEFEHKHTASFDSDVNQCFFDLLNKGVNDNAFATGFPASYTLLDSLQRLSLIAAPKRLSSFENQTPLGEIQFSKPVSGTTVQPGAQVDVALTLTGTLTLKNVLIMAAGSDVVELVNPPYTAVVTVPTDAYGTFVIFALGQGTDGNLYSASVTLSVNSSAVLQKVDVTPQSLYLDLGQELDISVTGTYSDGTIRSLSSSAQGTVYKSSDENILSVSVNGTVTPHAIGVGFVLVSPASSIPVTVRVEITASSTESVLAITPTSRDVSSGSGTTTFNVSNTGTGTMTWTAAVTSGGSWLSISSGTSGSNAGTVSCSFSANTGTSARSGIIRVTASEATGSPKDVTVAQAGLSGSLAVSFDGLGLWIYNSDSATWTQISTANSENIIYSGSTLYVDFGASYGLYRRDGAAWAQLTTANPENMVAFGSTLYADFGASGLYKFDGTAWTQLTTANPENMVTSGLTLYADFGASYGLYKWDGSAWSQLTSANPENVVTSGSSLYADFGTLGLYKWDGSAWSQLTPSNPENMVVSGSTLYASFGTLGLYKWDGSAWSQLTSAKPENMVTSGLTIYVDFGASYGLYKWDGSAWSQLASAKPENMVASGSTLYADFGPLGLYKWNGSSWAQLTGSNPAKMAISN